MKDRELLKLAGQVAKRAYAPYSKFKVGAALLARDGSVFTACNVENASYGLSICAERSAVFQAVAAGRKDFDAIAVAVPGLKGNKVRPCGACRQVLAEFGLGTRVVLPDRTFSVRDLLPEPFRL